MQERLQFQQVIRVDGYGLIVLFSDGTTATYTVDELARLRPRREKATEVRDEPPGASG